MKQRIATQMNLKMPPAAGMTYVFHNLCSCSTHIKFTVDVCYGHILYIDHIVRVLSQSPPSTSHPDSLPSPSLSFPFVQNVESYEYELPENFEDEEIEEDEAFNSEDERMYGHLFEDDHLGAGGGWTDEDDDEEEEEDEDEDEDDSEGAPTDLLDSDEEDINAILQRRKDGSDTSPSSEDDEDDSGTSSGNEQEEEEDDDEQRRQDLVESVTGRAQKLSNRLKHKQQVRTEAYPESEYNLPGMCFVV